MKKIKVAIVAAVASLSAMSPAFPSAFARFYASPRALSMGDAWVAMADDSSSVSANPAAMVQLERAEAALSYADLYGADGLAASRLAAVFPSDAAAAGFDWERLGLPGIYREDKITVAFARQLSGVLASGIGLKVLSAEVSGFEAPFYSHTRAAALNAGVLWQMSDVFVAGLAADDINEPEVAAGRRLPATYRFGIRYHPFDSGLVCAEVDSSGTGLRAGFETVVGGALAVRLGIAGGRPTFGFGIISRVAALDFALLTDSDLGLLTFAGLRIKI